VIKNFKTYFIVIFLSILFSLYFFEYYLINNVGYLNLHKKAKIMKEKTGMDYDKRTKIEVYKNLKKKYPNLTVQIIPKHYAINHQDKNFMPLSGLSNTKTLFCNEEGYYSMFESDRYGFNNPNTEWDKNEIEFLLVGDSFTMGECVNRPNDFASSLRTLSNLSALNLGYSSNGPNIQLAVLREYLDPKVKKVLWMYYEGNDLKDLEDTKNSKILSKYILNKEFTQNLKLRQTEIDQINRLEIQNFLSYHKERNKRSLKYSILRFIRLDKTKSFIIKLFNPEINPNTKIKDETFKRFYNVLKISKNYTNLMGAKFYFIYLSDYSSLLNNKIENKFNKKKVLEIVQNLNITYIDVSEEIINTDIDPLSLFPFGLPGHYSENGYRQISKIIYDKLSNE